MLPEFPIAVPTSNPVERERAFDVLFRRYYSPLCRFAARLVGNQAEAEEIVQELYLYVWDRHDVISETIPSRAYLYRAVHNAALNRLRHQRVEHRWAEGKGRPLDEWAEASAMDRLEQEELVVAVRRAIERLPERTRLVYTLSRQNQLTYAEIAVTLGISVKTVESQMTRALRHLRIALGPFVAGIVVLFG
jgi:RNA polymerase sigma-70 factor (family 1)